MFVVPLTRRDVFVETYVHVHKEIVFKDLPK